MPGESIYSEVGVTPLINAAGTFTYLGGSLMSPEAIAAWNQAATCFVDLSELQQRVGERLAQLLNVESALVTAGAASSILLATAAAMTIRDPDYVQRHPALGSSSPYEVLRQTAHRDLYDRQIEMCGVRIVDVDTVEDLAAHVSDRTVMMMAYNVHEPRGRIRHHEWIELARCHGIPTLLDAAADTPPVANLGRFNQLGYDLVAFSGGKAIRGPQGAGLLLGRADLIAAARQNAVPREGTVGRASKVSKEDIMAMWAAVRHFVNHGDQLGERCRSLLSAIQATVETIPTVSTDFVTPPIANCVPHLVIDWDPRKLSVSVEQMRYALRHGSPPIATDRVQGIDQPGLVISAINLQDGEELMVRDRICAILQPR